MPLLDPIGLIKGIRSGNVHYLPTSGCPIKDHYYDNPNFTQIREASGQEFQKTYMRN